MSLVALLLAYNCLLVANFVRSRLHYARPGARPRPRRLTRTELVILGIRQVALTLLLWISFEHGSWTLHSVGIRLDRWWGEIIVAGEIGYLAVVLANLAILGLAGKLKTMQLPAVRGNLRAWPRGRVAQGFAALFIMVFNPFVEELVMRGILIH